MPHEWPRSPGWTRKARAHVAETAGYVHAESGDCLQVQRMETGPKARGGRVPGRRFIPLTPADLGRLSPPPSWFLGFVLCPGDAIEPILRWARSQPRAYLTRVAFYHSARFDLDAFVKAWTRADLGSVERYAFVSWERFHHLYGLHHGIQSYEDHHGAAPVRPCSEDH